MLTLNMLKELRDLRPLRVVLLAAHPESIPETVRPGLSKKLQLAVPRACDHIVDN
jgi:hypothetical protein